MSTTTISLGKLGEVRQGLTLSRYIDAQGPSKRVLQVANLSGGRVRTLEDDRMEHVDDARAQEHYARKDQVLVSLRGSVLKAGVVPEELKDGVISSSLVAMDLDPELADPVFVAGLLGSRAMQRQALPLFTGVTVQGIPLSRFKTIRIELPPLEQQRRYAAAIQALDRYRQKVARVTTLREEELEAHLDGFVVKEQG